MRPHSNDTLVLPFSPFPHPRFTGLQEGSLHFGPHDTQERRIVSYRFSYRCVELCLFEALYPAPSARPFSKGLLVSLLRLVTRDLNTTFGHRPIKKGGARVLSYAVQMRLSFPYATFCLSYYVCLSAPAGHLPLEGKAAIREYHLPSSKQAAHHPCEPIGSPSTVIPSAAEGSLLHCRHMHTCTPHLNDTLVLPFSPFPRSRFTALQERSLHFGRDDV